MRYRIRGALLVGTSLLTITGYAIFVASRDGNARYAAYVRDRPGSRVGSRVLTR